MSRLAEEKVGIDIGRGGNVAVSQPPLNVLNIPPHFVEQSRHAMTKIVKTNVGQITLFDHSPKVHGDCVGGERSPVRRYTKQHKELLELLRGINRPALPVLLLRQHHPISRISVNDIQLKGILQALVDIGMVLPYRGRGNPPLDLLIV